MVCRTKGYLEDLYNYQNFANNQVGRNYLLKKIRDDNIRRR